MYEDLNLAFEQTLGLLWEMTKITLQGILFDEKSSYLRGPALAPALIRKAYHSNSANYYAEDGTEILPDLFEDKGDYKIDSYFDITDITKSNLALENPILTIGGDHSITYPVIKAIHSRFGKLDILHIDAHGDLYSNFEGDPYSHACPFYNIMKDGLAENLYQVGIRTLNKEQRSNAKKFGVHINEMKDFQSFKMPEFRNPLYLSLDMDALDPAFAPGVSHHEPGGLTTREVIRIIQNINVPLIGADIVEYNPERDINGMTAMVSAKLFREIISKMLANHQGA
ncbi:agmatinase [Muricauda sp. 2012CJ35-5]|uniref:Agmatinase n=1 Tax=Flagellimonas spongiicola TaxID=2942208 RepID=A0ABT0PQ12_9FLAO|nr:agmatinase [Allomuricauda spongiicola]MCL6273479.1 agmatinase [Allomuricauda spongiicola]